MDQATLSKMADVVMKDLVCAIEGQNVLPASQRPQELRVGRNVAEALKEYQRKYTGGVTQGEWRVKGLPIFSENPEVMPVHAARLTGCGPAVDLSWGKLFEETEVVEASERPVELSTVGREFFKRKAEEAGAMAAWPVVFPGSSTSWAMAGAPVQAFCLKIARAVLEAVGKVEGVILLYPSVKMEDDSIFTTPPNAAIKAIEPPSSDFDEAAGRG